MVAAGIGNRATCYAAVSSLSPTGRAPRSRVDVAGGSEGACTATTCVRRLHGAFHGKCQQNAFSINASLDKADKNGMAPFFATTWLANVIAVDGEHVAIASPAVMTRHPRRFYLGCTRAAPMTMPGAMLTWLLVARRSAGAMHGGQGGGARQNLGCRADRVRLASAGAAGFWRRRRKHPHLARRRSRARPAHAVAADRVRHRHRSLLHS